MSARALVMAAGNRILPAAPAPEDVFSVDLYSGTGAALTITNNIDLAGHGGLVMIRRRAGGQAFQFLDTDRTDDYVLSALDASAAANVSSNFSVSSTGFAQNNAHAALNASSALYSAWTFRVAPRFFDMVSYTGNGGIQTLGHNLGVVPGIIIVKCINVTEEWRVYHRSVGHNYHLRLHSAGVPVGPTSTAWGNTAPSELGFTVGSDTATNGSGNSYIAYLFAHDPDPTGIIQCSSWFFNQVDNGFSLQWEPQFVLNKDIESTTGGAENWAVFDSLRGMPINTTCALVNINGTGAETLTANKIEPIAEGFRIKAAYSTVSSEHAFMAIRRPTKVPTLGSQVFQPLIFTGDGTSNRLITTTVKPDLIWARNRTQSASGVFGVMVVDRFRTYPALRSGDIAAQGTVATFTTPTVGYGHSFSSSAGFGVSDDTTYDLNASSASSFALVFKRAPGFFDMVHRNADAVTDPVLAHNLGVVPELIIEKCINAASTNWYIRYAVAGAGKQMLFTTAAETSVTLTWTSTTFVPASSVSGNQYIYYLFATLAGISKVGFYTGNGSSQTIDCGFTTGARLVLIKRRNVTGDWLLWDTARGIVSGTDPERSLTSESGEATTRDSIDPATSGFMVNQVTGSDINVSGGTYLYFAIA